MRKLALSDEILLKVDKAARYIGGEVNSVMKDKNAVDIRFAMCFPDVYEIGMSNLGMMILPRCSATAGAVMLLPSVQNPTKNQNIAIQKMIVPHPALPKLTNELPFFLFFSIIKLPSTTKKSKKIEPNPFPSDSVIIIKKVCYCALP